MYRLGRMVILFFCVSSQAMGEEATSETAKERFLDFHEKVSDQLTTYADNIDQFFGSVKDQEVYNRTKLRFYQTFTKTESNKFESRFDFRLNLDLPRLKNRLRFSFEKKEKTATANLLHSEELLTEKERGVDKLRGGFSFLFEKIFDFEMKFSTGVRVDIPPTPYAEYKLSRNFKWKDKGSFRFYSNSFWAHRDGFGQSLSFDWSGRLSEDFLFRFVNEATWLDSTDKILTSHGPTLFQTLSPRRAMAYSARANYVNRPHYRVDNYVLSMTYRQVLSSDIFFYELTPSLIFPRIDNFRSEASVYLRFELVF